MKKIIAFFVVIIILTSGILFISKNLILNRILHQQIDSVCSGINFSNAGYKIKNGIIAVTADNILCNRKNSYIKIKQARVSYKIADLIASILKNEKPTGSLELKDPDIRISLDGFSKKSGHNFRFRISEVTGGRIVLILNGQSVVIDNIKTKDNKLISADLLYKGHRSAFLYQKNSGMLRVDFNHINLSDFEAVFPETRILNLENMSGKLNYNIHDNVLSVAASGSRIALKPYFDAALPFSVSFSINPKDGKNRYKASIYIKKGGNKLKFKFVSDGSRFRISLNRGVVDSTFLRRSSTKLSKIFRTYKITGKALIRNAAIEGRLKKWKDAAIYAAGSASDVNFKVTGDTPLFNNVSGAFRLKDKTVYLTKLSGQLGASAVSGAKIVIRKLFSDPVSDMLIPVHLKLDQYSRNFFKKLVIPENFHQLIGYADALSAETTVSIKNYHFKPVPFFPFKITMRNAVIFSRKKDLKLSSKLITVKRDTDVVKIESDNVNFDSQTYSGSLKLFVRLLSENPNEKTLSIEGKINAESMKTVLNGPDFPYNGSFNISAGKKITVYFNGRTEGRIAGFDSSGTITGNLSVKGQKYSGLAHLNMNNPLLSYKAELKFERNNLTISIKGKAGKGNFSAEGSYDTKKKYWFMTLRGSSIKLDLLSNLLKHEKRRKDLGRGTLRIKLDNIYYKHLTLPYVTAGFIFDNGFITSKNVKIRFLDAVMTANLTYSSNNSFIKGVFRYSGRNNNLLLDKIGLTGQIAAKRIEADGDFLVYLKRSYNVNVRFSAYKGNIKRFPALVKLLNYLSLKNILTLRLANFSKRGLKYKAINGAIAIKDGVMATTKPIIFKGELNMVFQGTYNIKQNNINGILGIKTFTLINKIISKIPIVGWILTGKDKSFSIMTFSVKDKLNNPLITPMPIKSVGEGVLNIIERSLTFPFEIIK
ncbi:MAG: hypothetical protein GXP60_00295 [Epsilonproteobacteria bacterium]|nr:hypothetical protein [Campylobacterota bacterium]